LFDTTTSSTKPQAEAMPGLLLSRKWNGLGIDGAGLVEAVGVGVVTVKPGDRVYIARSVSGTYAECALALKSQVHPLPELEPPRLKRTARPGNSSDGCRAGALDFMCVMNGPARPTGRPFLRGQRD
jgi:threonine dehydrogenase-like Zn-dependent dehydrogenase